MNELGFKCTLDNVFISLPEVSDETDAGIIKSEEMKAAEAAEKGSEMIAIIAGVGPNVTIAEVGDEVIINNHQLPIVEVHGKRYAAIKDYNIICIVDKMPELSV